MPSERPKTLAIAVHETAQVYGAAFICALVVICLVPWWIKWIGLYLTGLAFLTSVIAPFLDDFKPRSKVQAAGKAVYITGCDSGFGHSLAQRLDDQGYQVFAGCLFPDGEGASTLKKSGSSRLKVVPLDVTSDESIENAANFVKGNVGDQKLWAVVNNAGINDGSELLWTNVDIIKKVIDVNMYGVVKVTKSVLTLLTKHKGRVVTVASAAGRNTYPGMVPYCMSKQAAIGFCDGLRLEMYKFGLKVITVEPWMFKTNITNEKTIFNYIQRTWDAASPEAKELYPSEYADRMKKSSEKILNFSISHKPEQVVDCLEEAVTTINPKFSYNPGTVFSRLSFWVTQKLPKPVQDLLVEREFATSLL